jgi:hypothetical protein
MDDLWQLRKSMHKVIERNKHHDSNFRSINMLQDELKDYTKVI